ncbi:hypothetical protein [Endozoicomonas sp. SCSIO W0465]|uniref:hypothetical protein n=1 Tax=Endozoicomonas sp. SCSIO W0465 TaxID=2918516 RepID=UPI0020751A42|nr:hypothetical protein [Endozoicomonas sp. SCSIO W0465]USE36453.1 hypothetical protein MJO57_31310 [Endozoicomonas sp. SCSIO W0465]
MALPPINNNPSPVSTAQSSARALSGQDCPACLGDNLALKEERRAEYNGRSVVTLKDGKLPYHPQNLDEWAEDTEKQLKHKEPLNSRLILPVNESLSAMDEDFIEFAARSPQSYDEANETISITRAMYRAFLHNRNRITDDNIKDVATSLQVHRSKDYLRNDIPSSFSNFGSYSDPDNVPYLLWADHQNNGVRTTYLSIPGARANCDKLKVLASNSKASLETWGFCRNSANKIPRIHAGIKRAVEHHTQEGQQLNQRLKQFAKESLGDNRKFKIQGESFGGAFVDGLLTKLYSPNGLPGFSPAETEALKKNLGVATTGGFAIGNQLHAEWFNAQVIRNTKDEAGRISATNYMRIISDYDIIVPAVIARNPLKKFQGPRAFRVDNRFKIGHLDFFKLFQKVNREKMGQKK